MRLQNCAKRLLREHDSQDGETTGQTDRQTDRQTHSLEMEEQTDVR